MKTVLLTLFLTAITLLLGVSASAQSLSETQEWIVNSLHAAHSDWLCGGNGYSHYSRIDSPDAYSDESTQMEFNQCNVKITKQTHFHLKGGYADSPGGKPYDDYYAKTVEAFTFRDIDPRSFVISKQDGPITLTFRTTNERALIQCLTLPSSKPKKEYDDCIPPRTSDEVLRLASTAYAQRLSTALKRVTTLCGGKPSTF